MKYLPLLWKNLWRKKFRTIFTLLSVFVAFVLFGILMTIRTAFTFGVDIAGVDRLVLIHKVSLIMPLPVSYTSRLQNTPGVEVATHNTWFGGVYQDPSNFFAQIVVEPEPFMKIYPEYKLPPDQMKAWLDDRQGAIDAYARALQLMPHTYEEPVELIERMGRLMTHGRSASGTRAGPATRER